jgi:hypothetical protein
MKSYPCPSTTHDTDKGKAPRVLEVTATGEDGNSTLRNWVLDGHQGKEQRK